MKINLTDQQVRVLYKHHTAELEAARHKVEELESILQQLQDSDVDLSDLTESDSAVKEMPATPTPAQPAKKRAYKKRSTTKKTKSSKKSDSNRRNAPSQNQWLEFVTQSIMSADKPMSTAEFLRNGTEFFKLNKKEAPKDRAVLARALKELTKDTNTLQTAKIPNSRGYYYGLPEMFDKNGEVTAKYAKKLD